MKTLLFVLAVVFAGYGMVGRTTAANAGPTVDIGSPGPTPAVSTNEGGCWDKCKTCEQACRAQSGDALRACNDACWKTNDSCCAGVGGKGVYKTCGCTDK